MSLVHNIVVTNDSYEVAATTRQNVHRRLEYIRYGTQVPERDVLLEYIAYTPITANAALSIVDRSAEFLNNNTKATRSFTDEFAFTGKNYFSTTASIVITDQYVVLSDGTVNPYFYSHTLPADTQQVSVYVTSTSGSIEVSSSEFTTNSDKTALFANFLNYFDEISGRYSVYYVSSVDSSGNRVTELYNPEDAFHEATFDDIDPVSGLLAQGTNAYILNTSGTGYLFTLPQVDTYYIKEKLAPRITLLEPALQTADDPWITRITAGDFDEIINGVTNNYFIEEYTLQAFVPAAPTKYAAYEIGTRITDSLIKAQRETLNIDPDIGLHIEVTLYDNITGELKYALSTDTDKQDTEYGTTDILYKTDIIADWDEYNGILRLDGVSIKEEYEIRLSYFYDEEAYEYTALNLNPINNPEIADKLVVIYVVPNTKGTEEASVYHLIVKDNIIIYSSQFGGDVVPPESQFLEDGSPNPNTVVGKHYSSEGLYDDAFSVLHPEYLILAEITVLEPNRINDAFRIDLRTNGGGIRKDEVENAVLANSRIAYLPGIAPIGGYPFPKYASHVVKVPYTLLTAYGGELSEDIVRSKVQKHMSAGEYPVIVYDGIIPEIYEIVPGECIILRWYREDPTYTFRIYRSLNETSGFELLDTVAGHAYQDNEYEDCSVSPGVGYYYYITAVSPSNIESPKSVTFGAKAYVG